MFETAHIFDRMKQHYEELKEQYDEVGLRSLDELKSALTDVFVYQLPTFYDSLVNGNAPNLGLYELSYDEAWARHLFNHIADFVDTMLENILFGDVRGRHKQDIFLSWLIMVFLLSNNETVVWDEFQGVFLVVVLRIEREQEEREQAERQRLPEGRRQIWDEERRIQRLGLIRIRAPEGEEVDEIEFSELSPSSSIYMTSDTDTD
jgi:hypothetical protein